MKQILSVLAIAILGLCCCNRGASDLDIDVSGIPDPEFCIERYGSDLFKADPGKLGEELPRLAEKYPMFLGEPPLDTLSFIQIHDFITDPFLREIAAACEQEFPGLEDIEKQLNNAWRHYRYYFPGSSAPHIYTYVSGLDFENPVQMQDSIMLIALDMYLGSNFEPYGMARIPQYRTRRANREYLVRDVMLEVASNIPVTYREDNILLDQMIEHGKMLYFLDATIPDVHDTIKIGYTYRQLHWCEANERNLWAFIIENELLFSSDYEKTHKLIIDGPFTSFFPEGSPGRTGWWVGWQIVRSFMEKNPDTSLKQMMEDLTARQVLDNSGYNP
ncbi:MAG TPA: hypothetical protein VK994_06770 [Bacteroidales bacterium]|nr:hypothetical protein [Bacteroidales bacterium]